MKSILKIPLIMVSSLLLLYVIFVAYIKLNNSNPLYMDYRYNRVITRPLANIGCANAQFKVGLHYLYGRAIIPPKGDLDEAIYWLERAVANGSEKAVEELKVAQNPEDYPQYFL